MIDFPAMQCVVFTRPVLANYSQCSRSAGRSGCFLHVPRWNKQIVWTVLSSYAPRGKTRYESKHITRKMNLIDMTSWKSYEEHILNLLMRSWEAIMSTRLCRNLKYRKLVRRRVYAYQHQPASVYFELSHASNVVRGKDLPTDNLTLSSNIAWIEVSHNSNIFAGHQGWSTRRLL